MLVNKARVSNLIKQISLVVTVSLLLGCGPEAKIPSAGPRAVAWIDGYIAAVMGGATEAEAIEYANFYSRTRKAGETK